MPQLQLLPTTLLLVILVVKHVPHQVAMQSNARVSYSPSFTVLLLFFPTELLLPEASFEFRRQLCLDLPAVEDALDAEFLLPDFLDEVLPSPPF